MGNSTIIWQFCCVVDIISSHITKFFQIWLTVAGYDELCVGFYISQLEMGKYFECLSNNISIVKLILIFSLKGVLFPCSSNTLTRIRYPVTNGRKLRKIISAICSGLRSHRHIHFFPTYRQLGVWVRPPSPPP